MESSTSISLMLSKNGSGNVIELLAAENPPTESRIKIMIEHTIGDIRVTIQVLGTGESSIDDLQSIGNLLKNRIIQLSPENKDIVNTYINPSISIKDIIKTICQQGKLIIPSKEVIEYPDLSLAIQQHNKAITNSQQ